MPVPNNKDMRFVITSVYMTSLEKIDFLPAVGPQSPQSLAFFSKLTLDEPDDLRLRAEDGSLHSLLKTRSSLKNKQNIYGKVDVRLVKSFMT